MTKGKGKGKDKDAPAAAEVGVFCAHTEMREIEKLVPHPRNPNRHPEKQIALLAKIIRAQGWRNPIVVSRRSGFVIKGHARLEAAKVLNVLKVPVDLQNYENEASEFADMIADNRIAELAELDMPTIKDLLQELDDGSLDMDLTGFDKETLEKLMTAIPPIDVPVPSCFKVEIDCKDEQQQRVVFERMVKEGFECRLLTL